jgi:hypothetical protein
MELDELKYQLNKKLETEHVTRSASDIALLIQAKSKSIVDKIKRSLIIEIFFGIICLIWFTWQGLYNHIWSMRVYFSSFIVFAIISLIVLIYLFKKTNRFSNADLPIKVSLQKIYDLIYEYKVWCYRITIALIPICLIYSFVLGYHEGRTNTVEEYDKIIAPFKNHMWLFFLIDIIYIIVFVTAMIYFIKWWLKKLYGRYLTELKLLIEELEV